MDKLEMTRQLLERLNMPIKQQRPLCCLTLLAMAGLDKHAQWAGASNTWLRIHDIIIFIRNNYGIDYAENSRETIRKQAIHPFRTAAIIEDNGMATNSPNYRYRITDEFLEVMRGIGKDENEPLAHFISNHNSLKEIYASKKQMLKMPVKINGKVFDFSPGKHNQLQKAIIEEFAPRFAPESECLYIGDTIQKDMVLETERLSQLGLDITLHDKMPDVILYCEDKHWIYFIECVTSVGPMNPKRIFEIETMTANVTAGNIYVTAFLDFATFKKFSEQLAWDTEVWIANMPDHMIHLNGDKFLGPRQKKNNI